MTNVALLWEHTGTLASILDRYGYLAVAAFVFLEDFGIPVPGETILIAAAVDAGTGGLNVVILALVAWVAAVAGDNVGFTIGHFGGRRLALRYGRYVLLTEARLDKVQRFFERYGAAVVAFARFIEGLRQLNGIAAGISKMRWRRFLMFNALGAALWCGVWVSVGYFAGDHVHAIYAVFLRYQWYVIAAIAALIVFLIVRTVRRHRGTGEHV